MKKMFALLAFFSLSTVFAQIEKDLGNFSSIKVSDKIDVQLIPSSENRIELSGEKSDEVELVNRDGQLKIRMKALSFLKGDNITAKVYFQELDEIVATKGARITSSAKLEGTSMKLTANQGASIDLEIDVKRVEAKTNSGGEINLKGKTEVQSSVSNSGGGYFAKGLDSQHAEVTVNAGGTAEITASDTVEAKTRAGGDIQVWGTAEVNETKVAGGNVKVHR